MVLCPWDCDGAMGVCVCACVCVCGEMFISKGIDFLAVGLTDKSEIVLSKY